MCIQNRRRTKSLLSPQAEAVEQWLVTSSPCHTNLPYLLTFLVLLFCGPSRMFCTTNYYPCNLSATLRKMAPVLRTLAHLSNLYDLGIQGITLGRSPPLEPFRSWIMGDKLRVVSHRVQGLEWRYTFGVSPKMSSTHLSAKLTHLSYPRLARSYSLWGQKKWAIRTGQSLFHVNFIGSIFLRF